jgi:hypothetical protein
MDGAESDEQVSRGELDRVAREVRWLVEHAREPVASRDLLARCTIFSATLAALLAYCLPWGRVADGSGYTTSEPPRLTGWQLVDYWQDDVDTGFGGFIAAYLVAVLVLSAIAGLCVLVPLPKAVGLALSVLLWLLTAVLGLVIMADTGRLEFDFELTASIAVIVTGALAASWTWWTACTEAAFWRPTTD